jgi:hypothetical protein
MDKPLVYQATDGRWLVFFNDIKSDYFNIESEATSMASKITWGTQAQTDATTLAQVADRLANLESVYFDRGYNSGGSDPIGDIDVASLGVTAAQLGSLITLIQQLNNFLGNSAVTTADYDATLNAVRSDV